MSRRELQGEVYIAIAHWLWGYSPDMMPYGPPDRGLKDRFAMWLYERGRVMSERKP